MYTDKNLDIMNRLYSNKNINYMAESYLKGEKDDISESDMRDIVGFSMLLKESTGESFVNIFDKVISYIKDKSGGRFDFYRNEEKFDYNLFLYLDTKDEKYKTNNLDNSIIDHITYNYFAKNPNKQWLDIITRIENEIK